MVTQAPRGTYDLFGSDIRTWQMIEKEVYALMEEYRFQEIRTPIFEHTELFQRGVGDTTDIVQKEMYTFLDKGGRSITLKPEGTAGAARAYLERKLFADAQPTKLFYLTPCFRYEKPQAGRDRQFYQFGCELYGAGGYMADVEVMSIAYSLLTRLGISNVTLHINSLGGPQCRKAYNQKLAEYFTANREKLCPTCQERLNKNPLRILDCKSPVCQEVVKDAPSTIENLGAECREHFDNLAMQLTELGIPFVVDSGIVRGLDYYTRTVFEFVCNDIGAQGTICGGGRYDGLIEELGGDPTPAVGFAIGIGRLIMAMEAIKGKTVWKEEADLYIGHIGDSAGKTASRLAYMLRSRGFRVETDLMGRSVKAQMKYANKIGARFTLILGDTEITQREAVLKNMEDGSTVQVQFEDLDALGAAIR